VHAISVTKSYWAFKDFTVGFDTQYRANVFYLEFDTVRLPSLRFLFVLYESTVSFYEMV